MAKTNVASIKRTRQTASEPPAAETAPTRVDHEDDYEGIPDFHDLLIRPRSAYNAERVSSAAGEEFSALTRGMAAIGHVLWLAHTIDEDANVGIEREHVASLGYLVQKLAVQVDAIANLADHAEHRIHQAELGKLSAVKS